MMSIALEISRDKISKDGNFLPFGLVLETTGKVSIFETEGSSEQAEAHIVEKFRSLAVDNKILGSAVCFDVRVLPPGENVKMNAIKIVLESRGVKPMHGFQLYGFNHEGKLVFAELEVQEDKSLVFV